MNAGDSEILELERLFQKKNITKTPVKEGHHKGGGSEHKLARLIDLTRANNISISGKGRCKISKRISWSIENLI